MARTRTAGIQVEADGSKVVDKRVFGVRIKWRVSAMVSMCKPAVTRVATIKSAICTWRLYHPVARSIV